MNVFSDLECTVKKLHKKMKSISRNSKTKQSDQEEKTRINVNQTAQENIVTKKIVKEEVATIKVKRSQVQLKEQYSKMLAYMSEE